MDYNPEHAALALSILERLLPRVTSHREYEELVEILRDKSRWHEAHALFNEIRVNITLPLEAHPKSDLDFYFVYIAENAAKTAYNCSGRPAPFDADSFDWLLRCEAEFLKQIKK